MKRLVFLVEAGALLFMACSSSPSAPTPGPQVTTTPPAAATSAPNQPPVQATPGVPQPNAGDNESRARAIVPPGSTELSEASFGNAYQLTVTSTQSLAQLDAFFAQAIPAAGMQLTGKFTLEGSLTIAFTNPDGGISATEDSSTGGSIIVISVGTS